MKKLYLLIALAGTLLLCASCGSPDTNNITEPSTDAQLSAESVYDSEASSYLARTDIPNVDKVDYVYKLAGEEVARAEVYREKIKSSYRETVSNYSEFYDNVDFELEDAYESLDDYCDYLKNEFDANAEFFDDYAVVKYQTGTAASSWKAKKYYEAAKIYADKMEALYEDIIQW